MGVTLKTILCNIVHYIRTKKPSFIRNNSGASHQPNDLAKDFLAISDSKSDVEKIRPLPLVHFNRLHQYAPLCGLVLQSLVSYCAPLYHNPAPEKSFLFCKESPFPFCKDLALLKTPMDLIPKPPFAKRADFAPGYEVKFLKIVFISPRVNCISENYYSFDNIGWNWEKGQVNP